MATKSEIMVVAALLLFSLVLSPAVPAEAARSLQDLIGKPPICPACVCCTPRPPKGCCACCTTPGGPIAWSSP